MKTTSKVVECLWITHTKADEAIDDTHAIYEDLDVDDSVHGVRLVRVKTRGWSCGYGESIRGRSWHQERTLHLDASHSTQVANARLLKSCMGILGQDAIHEASGYVVP